MTNDKEEADRIWQSYMQSKRESAEIGLKKSEERLQKIQQKEQELQQRIDQRNQPKSTNTTYSRQPPMPTPSPRLPQTRTGEMPIPSPFPPNTMLRTVVPQHVQQTPKQSTLQSKGTIQQQLRNPQALQQTIMQLQKQSQIKK